MKSMTCKQLGGACDLVFQADSFEEMAHLSQQHGAEMYQKGDEAHLQAMAEVQKLMSSPEKMNEWMTEKRKLFDSLPEG